MAHDCTDSPVHLSHVNIDPEQNCCDHIAYCLDNQYHTLRKNMPTYSEFLFGNDLPKNNANKKLFSTFETSFHYHLSKESSKNWH